MVPLDTLTTWQQSTGARFLQRYNLYRTAAFSGTPAPGASSGDAIRALEEVAARDACPKATASSGRARASRRSRPATVRRSCSALSIVVVFLFLAALYESWAVPFAVLLATPFGFMGALVALKALGIPFNVYGQIGLVTLVGLSAKNAILIVEFAKLNREKGMPIFESAVDAARLRLRPILMTSFAFILGVVPLILASGAGAASKVSVGVTVFGGMIFATVFTTLAVPAFYVLIQGLSERFGGGPPAGARAAGRSSSRRGGRDMSARHCVAVAVLATLAGCAIGPDYERPTDLPAPVEYRGVLAAQDAESIADLPWTEVFNDPELRQVIETALANNLDLKIAAARVEEFRGRARVSRSYLGPSLGVSGSTSPAPGTAEDSTYSLGLALNWEIDLFGRLRRANEAARAQLLATEDIQRGVVNALVADVATTWFRLREIDEEVRIIERTIESQAASLELVRALKRSGVNSAAEEMQALSQLSATRSQLPQAELTRVQTENLLRLLLGGEPGPVARPGPPDTFAVPDDIPVGLPAQLLARRPDLRQLENELHAATANVGVAEATRFPYLSIGLTSFFGLISPELGRLLDGDDPAQELFSVGPFVNMPIYQSGYGTGNVEVARAQLKQSELAYRSGVLQALRETADALVVTDKTRSIIAETVIRRDAADRLLDLQKKRYKAGVVSYIEVLDAQRQLFAAEIELAQTRLSRVVGYVDLYRALGGGWSAPP